MHSVNRASYLDIADISHASRSVVEFFHGYFTAKSRHNASQWLDFFHSTQVVYYDATLGQGFPSRSALVTAFTELEDSTPKNATSYPLRILGDTVSAVVHYVDTPEWFGAEVQPISAIEFLDGKVTRRVDCWDARRNPAIVGRLDQCPYDLGLESVKEHAAPEITRVAIQLNAALSTRDATAAARLFSYDAIFEDSTLRARQEGQLAICRYLERALSALPYGPGTTLRHILGSAQGGGYEWQAQNHPELNGITVLELDENELITQLTTVWDGSRLNDSAILALAALSVKI
jgi:hypothetical protein